MDDKNCKIKLRFKKKKNSNKNDRNFLVHIADNKSRLIRKKKEHLYKFVKFSLSVLYFEI